MASLKSHVFFLSSQVAEKHLSGESLTENGELRLFCSKTGRLQKRLSFCFQMKDTLEKYISDISFDKKLLCIGGKQASPLKVN